MTVMSSDEEVAGEEQDEAIFHDFSTTDIRRTTRVVLGLTGVLTLIGIGLLAWWSRVQTENACSDLSVIDQMAPDRAIDGVDRKLVEACRSMKVDSLPLSKSNAD
ncbi:hypothetical protein ACVIGB_001060 [Bradyrhizobium sp. USDA 4341]